MQEKPLYVRIRGKVLGPFGFTQLKSLRDRGQFRRFHEVSDDRRNWVSASTLGELFPVEEPARESFSVAKENGGQQADVALEPLVLDRKESPPSQSVTEWHYIDAEEKRQGPVSMERLLVLAQSGSIQRSTALWKPGMQNWAPAESVPELVFSETADRAAPDSRQMSKLAVAALIFALLWIVGIGSLLGIFFSLWALHGIRRSEGRISGKGVAIAGLILGILFLALTPVAVLITLKSSIFARTNILRLPGSATPQEITEAYKTRIYTIKADSSLGSGVLVANNRTRGLVATNLHVIDEKLLQRPDLRKVVFEEVGKMSVLAKNPTQLNFKGARLAAFHRSLDLALLIIELEEAKPSAVSIIKQKNLKQGEGAVALGNPLGKEFFTSSGIVSSTSGEEGYIWSTCPLSPGNSGGPLFLTRGGLLAGINTMSAGGVVRRAQNLNGSIPAEEIVATLRSRRTENWVWAYDLKELTLELVDMIPLEE